MLVDDLRNKIGRTVTRVVLREAIYRSFPGFSRREASTFLDVTLEELCDALARGEAVKLSGFGTFSVRHKQPRVGRNPRTGAEAAITGRRVLTFKASAALVARVNRDSNTK